MLIVVETFRQVGEPTSAELRVRPIPGQPYGPDVRVECSKAMRASAPIGARFRLAVKEKRRQGGPVFLYSNHRDPWERVG